MAPAHRVQRETNRFFSLPLDLLIALLSCSNARRSLRKASIASQPHIQTNQKHSPVCVADTTSLCSNNADWSNPNVDQLLVFQIGPPSNESVSFSPFQPTCSSCCWAYWSFLERVPQCSDGQAVGEEYLRSCFNPHLDRCNSEKVAVIKLHLLFNISC